MYNEVIVKYKKLHPSAILPKKATDGSAGYDLFTYRSVLLRHEERETVGIGLAFEIPVGSYAFILSKSGLSSKFGIHAVNSPGLIDSDFRDEVGVILGRSDKDDPSSHIFNYGDKIAQILFQPDINVHFLEVDELSQTDRKGGFGSTGK